MLRDSAWRALSLSGAGPPSHGTEQGPPPRTLRACPPWTRFPETLASPRGEQMQRVGKGTQDSHPLDSENLRVVEVGQPLCCEALGQLALDDHVLHFVAK